MNAAIVEAAERGLLPDVLVRAGIRSLVRGRLREERAGDPEAQADRLRARLARMRSGPIAVSADAANSQHYALPPALFRLMLGPRMKYSCCYFDGPDSTLASAEERMLEKTCERARLDDGMRILELGCGWGSLTLYMAERHRTARITAMSNSAAQREWIEARCRERGLRNVEVVTCDINDFRPAGRFDRVVSVEMFEHVRNYELLLERIATWLAPGGSLFVHLFCSRAHPYFYETVQDTVRERDGKVVLEASNAGGRSRAGTPAGDWMTREFFTGGTMPSDDLLLHFQRHVELEDRWRVGGLQYARTLRAWLGRLDAARDEALALLAAKYGAGEAPRRLQRWRLFLIACEELFALRGGGEWYVAHYRFRGREAAPRRVVSLEHRRPASPSAA